MANICDIFCGIMEDCQKQTKHLPLSDFNHVFILLFPLIVPIHRQEYNKLRFPKPAIPPYFL